jgi:hypothetical protein
MTVAPRRAPGGRPNRSGLVLALALAAAVACAHPASSSLDSSKVQRCPNAPLVCMDGDYRCTYDTTQHCEACSCVPGVQSPTSPFVPR